jgi:hypothetical protein
LHADLRRATTKRPNHRQWNTNCAEVLREKHATSTKLVAVTPRSASV